MVVTAASARMAARRRWERKWREEAPILYVSGAEVAALHPLTPRMSGAGARETRCIHLVGPNTPHPRQHITLQKPRGLRHRERESNRCGCYFKQITSDLKSLLLIITWFNHMSIITTSTGLITLRWYLKMGQKRAVQKKPKRAL